MNSTEKLVQFQNIINDHKGILYKVISIYCKNTEDRKDLEQEILIQLWKSLGNYNNSYKISTWLYRIAMNVSISFYRTSQRKNKTIDIEIEPIFSERFEEEQEDRYSTQKALLKNFINSLNDFNKAIIILYMEEYSYKEISEMVGITETNVGTKINRIKSKLKKYITENK